MRIVHTSDWHAGKVWKGQKRLPELEAVLDFLADFIERERIDLLLMSGDIFDTGAPAAPAERVVFRFLHRIGRAGAQSVVIAGNHDSPARLEAWGILTELVDCHVVARPKPPERGGVLEITAHGERALVAAVPFAGVRYLVAAAELATDEVKARATYGDQMRRLIEHAAGAFRADTINLLMAHTFIDGAVIAGSERKVHVGREWAVSAQALPPSAHYAALGHIHRPQALDGLGCPAVYAGSPLQLDFGEAGQEKSFVVLDAQANQPVRAERIPYEGGRPLVEHTASLAELEVDAERLREAGWLRVTVPLEVPDPDLNSKVRRLLPNAVVVKVELPANEVTDPIHRPQPGATPSDLYGAYFEHRYQHAPEPALLETFQNLYDQAGGS